MTCLYSTFIVPRGVQTYGHADEHPFTAGGLSRGASRQVWDVPYRQQQNFSTPCTQREAGLHDLFTDIALPHLHSQLRNMQQPVVGCSIIFNSEPLSLFPTSKSMSNIRDSVSNRYRRSPPDLNPHAPTSAFGAGQGGRTVLPPLSSAFANPYSGRLFHFLRIWLL